LKHLYGTKASEEVQVLYGGSVTADTAASYLSLEDVDGLLIGGASLDASEFANIIEKAYVSKK